jgi:pyrroline-5-carboxylate reductase
MSNSADGAILLVGAGRMGGALLRGWLAQGIKASRIFVQEPSPAPEMAELLKSAGVAVDNPPALPSPPAVMLLAVKPQIMDDVLPTVAPLAGPETVVLSIAAGRTIASLTKHFSPEATIVRAMPNTPAAIGRGMTVLCANQAATQPQNQLCEELLRASGEVAWVDDEALMDAVTAVSGSGPAYVFLLAECLAEAGKAAGLPPETAARLARVTVAGAGELLHQSAEDAAALRRAVTSPGGTTAAALAVLMGEGDAASAATGPLGDLMRHAAEAAAKRSRELAGE